MCLCKRNEAWVIGLDSPDSFSSSLRKQTGETFEFLQYKSRNYFGPGTCGFWRALKRYGSFGALVQPERQMNQNGHIRKKRNSVWVNFSISCQMTSDSSPALVNFIHFTYIEAIWFNWRSGWTRAPNEPYRLKMHVKIHKCPILDKSQMVF